ncbi:MAG: alpha/beta hydrolase [Eubacteriaceae bacterium]|nr:alpha/beta hydrolase [Eubacteriaceae bacterium]
MEIGNRRISIFSDIDFEKGPIVYMHMNSEDMEQLAVELADMNTVLVAIDGVDWNRDLSPWAAKRAFRGGEDFTGGADAYLKELTELIIPTVEDSIDFMPSTRILAGYSLAGLFALYAMYNTAIFNRIGSISGSLWYDEFLEFMMANQPMQNPDRVYFSLGDREKINRNQRFAVVEELTHKAQNHMQSLGSDTVFDFTPGNHFEDTMYRIAKGLRWLMLEV